jgi:hypothetical protein
VEKGVAGVTWLILSLFYIWQGCVADTRRECGRITLVRQRYFVGVRAGLVAAD